VTAVSSLHERLAEVAGADSVRLNPEISAGDLKPAILVAPRTLEQAAACLRAAQESGAGVVPWGGGTQQRIGHPPEAFDLALSTEHLSRTIEWEPADLTAGFEAGLTLAAVQTQLAQSNQQLAIDAPRVDHATLGGLIATNFCGPRRWLYGGWRDQIIGMRMALTSGEVIKSGGRVVKNVQGYDLAKLFTGSLGTLGLIGQVNVKLIPLPEARRLIAVTGELTRVSELIEQVEGAALRVSTLDLLDSAAAGGLGLPAPGAAALLLLEGPRVVVDGQSRRIESLASGQALATQAIDGDVLTALWTRWVDLDRSDDLADDEVLFTIAARPSEVLEAMQAVQRIAEAAQAGARSWARAGNGIVYARLQANRGEATSAFSEIQHQLLQRWPATTAVASSTKLAEELRVWGLEPAGTGLMRALKQRFDPPRTLQPGRYVGGI
jgi:glycolate dehydrogenase FAD-binding subunit